MKQHIAEKSALARTLFAWSRELGMSRETLAKRLRATDLHLKRNQLITARQIFNAWTGGKDEAQAREANARAELLEYKLRFQTGEIITYAEVEKMFGEVLLPCRQRLLAMPSECAHTANPTDPAHAQAALQDWVNINLPVMRGMNTKKKSQTQNTQ